MTMCSCIECVGYQREPTDEELAAYEAEMDAAEESYKAPPCLECGVMTANAELTDSARLCGEASVPPQS